MSFGSVDSEQGHFQHWGYDTSDCGNLNTIAHLDLVLTVDMSPMAVTMGLETDESETTTFHRTCCDMMRSRIIEA